MSTDDARGVLAEALAEVFGCRAGRVQYEFTGSNQPQPYTLCLSNAHAQSLHMGSCEFADRAAAALLASPQFARLIEQREAAARAEALREAATALGHIHQADSAGASACIRWLKDHSAVLAGRGGESGEGA